MIPTESEIAHADARSQHNTVMVESPLEEIDTDSPLSIVETEVTEFKDHTKTGFAAYQIVRRDRMD